MYEFPCQLKVCPVRGFFVLARLMRAKILLPKHRATGIRTTDIRAGIQLQDSCPPRNFGKVSVHSDRKHQKGARDSSFLEICRLGPSMGSRYRVSAISSVRKEVRQSADSIRTRAVRISAPASQSKRLLPAASRQVIK